MDKMMRRQKAIAVLEELKVKSPLPLFTKSEELKEKLLSVIILGEKNTNSVIQEGKIIFYCV